MEARNLAALGARPERGTEGTSVTALLYLRASSTFPQSRGPALNPSGRENRFLSEKRLFPRTRAHAPRQRAAPPGSEAPPPGPAVPSLPSQPWDPRPSAAPAPPELQLVQVLEQAAGAVRHGGGTVEAASELPGGRLLLLLLRRRALARLGADLSLGHSTRPLPAAAAAPSPRPAGGGGGRMPASRSWPKKEPARRLPPRHPASAPRLAARPAGHRGTAPRPGERPPRVPPALTPGVATPAPRGRAPSFHSASRARFRAGWPQRPAALLTAAPYRHRRRFCSVAETRAKETEGGLLVSTLKTMVIIESCTGLDWKGPQSPPSATPVLWAGQPLTGSAAQGPPSLALSTSRTGAPTALWVGCVGASPSSE